VRLQEFKQNAFAHAQTFSLENILPMYENYYETVFKTSMLEFVI